MKTPYKLLPLTTLALAMQVSALTIIPHLTSGPKALADASATMSFEGYKPFLNNNKDKQYSLDCAEVRRLEARNPSPNPETLAICDSIADIEKHFRDDVIINVEMYKIDFSNPAVYQSDTASTPIGLTLYDEVSLYVNSKNPDKGKAYDAGIKLMQKDNIKRVNQDTLVNYLPSFKELKIITPDMDYYQNNPNFPDGKWRPTTLSFTPAHLKIFGTKLPANIKVTNNEGSSYNTLPNMDGFIGLANDKTNPAIKWDLTPMDGIGLVGPFSREIYNKINALDPGTIPDGFSLYPRYLDFKWVVRHELLHVLGFVSKIDELESSPNDQNSVTPMDLFRIPETAIGSITDKKSFKAAPRLFRSYSASLCNVQAGKAAIFGDFNPNSPYHIIPMSSGVMGDGNEASHLRSPFNLVLAFPGLPCGVQYAVGFNYYASPYTSKAFTTPPGISLMVPGGLYNAPMEGFTSQDLRVMELIGWDVDYAGKQPVSNSRAPQSALDREKIMALIDNFARDEGIQLKYSIRKIREHSDEFKPFKH